MQAASTTLKNILFSKDLGGKGKPLIILHGLFGSSKNWHTTGSALTSVSHVHLIDQRNHGLSFHSDSHTIDDMVADIKNWIEYHHIPNPILLGHSMGGLVACSYSLLYPSRVEGLIVVDIAPREYQISYENEFKALGIDFSNLKDRAEIDNEMSKFLDSRSLRGFLQMNIHREGTKYVLRLNLSALKKARRVAVVQMPPGRQYKKDTIFLKGEDSDFIQPEDKQTIKKYFPNGRVRVIQGAKHWHHHTHSEIFLEETTKFIKGIR